MSWRDSLQPASYRGVSFFVEDEGGEFGMRSAIHEYPYRDEVWAEEIGLSPDRFEVRGFLIGDSVFSQRDQMIRAAKSKGAGQLIHPTYGMLSVQLAAPLRALTSKNRGGVVELFFAFIKAGKRLFPSASTSTSDAVSSAAASADVAVQTDYASQVTSALSKGAAVATQGATAIGDWAGNAITLGNDATSLSKMVQQLPGNFGRYFSGGNASSFTGITQGLSDSSASVSSLISAGASSRSLLSGSVDNLNSVTSELGI